MLTMLTMLTMRTRYELSGGFIKNALMSALLRALGRNKEAPVVTAADIVEGCRLQMRGSLQMKTFDHRVIPRAGFDALVRTQYGLTPFQTCAPHALSHRPVTPHVLSHRPVTPHALSHRALPCRYSHRSC
jgi:hypothetical protein